MIRFVSIFQLSLVLPPAFGVAGLSVAEPEGGGGARLAALADVAARAEKHESLSIVFLGGSLTWGANASDPNRTSWRGLMMQWLRDTHPKTPFTFHDAAIGGTGSDLALFRLKRDVLAHKPDVVFLDFTLNDGRLDGSPADDIRLSTYERLLREILSSGSAVVPVLMCAHHELATDADTPLSGRYREHLGLLSAYGIQPVDTRSRVRNAIIERNLRPEELYPIGGDKTHPGDAGYGLFFDAIRETWLATVSSQARVRMPSAPVYKDRFAQFSRHVLTNTEKTLPSGWRREKTWRISMWFDGLSSRWMGDVACASLRDASASVEPLEVPFRGSFVALFGERNRSTPPFRVWIDGRPLSRPGSKTADACLWNIDTRRFSASGNLFAWTVLSSTLSDGEHTLKILPDFSEAPLEAELRIESICAAGCPPSPPPPARTETLNPNNHDEE